MKALTQIEINSSKEAIWQVITDIEHSEKTISGIKKIEVLERPEKGVLGLKWRETRVMFGKEATEIMWITDLEENVYYRTRAESHGSIYMSTLKIKEKGERCQLSMGFEGEAVSLSAKFFNVLFSRMMAKSTEKALYVDLEDIKKAVEKN